MPEAYRLHLDFKGTFERAEKGTLRAAAFVGAVEQLLARGPLESAVVPGENCIIQLVPDPLPPALRDELPAELRAWTIGNALRDLDQFLSLMLDQCWDLIEGCKIASGERQIGQDWKRIDAETNVAKKHRKVLQAAGGLTEPLAADNFYLKTLSQARNCLSHNLGIVDRRRAPDGEMPLEWLRVRVSLGEGEDAIDLQQVQLPRFVEKDTAVVIDVVVEQRIYRIDERVILTPSEFMQICLLYRMIMARLIEAIQEHARCKGVIVRAGEVTEQHVSFPLVERN